MPDQDAISTEPETPPETPVSETLREPAQTEAPAEESISMLDIHDAHHAAGTWRDFFIHIATIVLGLIIAIGLEQTVVYFDHQQQRRELFGDLEAEASHNLPILNDDVNSGLIVERWDQAVLNALRAAKPENGTSTVIVPSRPDYPVRRSASRAVWTVAHTNGTAALVPEDIAEVLDHCDYGGELTYKALDDVVTADSESMAVEARVGVKLEPGVTLRLSAADRDDLARSLAHSMAANADLLYAATSWAAMTDAVAHQVQTREAMNVYIVQHRAALAEARAR
jgi:hypothetical protein